MIGWMVQGEGFGNCNCDHCCPCQSEGLPTHNSCTGFEVFRVERGHFGDVDLSGVTAAVFFDWPGPRPLVDISRDAAGFPVRHHQSFKGNLIGETGGHGKPAALRSAAKFGVADRSQGAPHRHHRSMLDRAGLPKA